MINFSKYGKIDMRCDHCPHGTHQCPCRLKQAGYETYYSGKLRAVTILS